MLVNGTHSHHRQNGLKGTKDRLGDGVLSAGGSRQTPVFSSLWSTLLFTTVTEYFKLSNIYKHL